MEEKSTRETIFDVFVKVLEDATFLFPSPLSSSEAPEPHMWEALGCALRFDGANTGEVHLWAGKDFAQVIAANMLGIDENTPDALEKGPDAIKEFLNIITGNFLTSYFGSEQIFNLGIPELLSDDQLSVDFSSGEPYWVQAEDYPLLFTVTIV